LSGRADNRVATISVQAAYALEDSKESDSKGHILGTSPSTGIEVKKMNNAVMNALMKQHEKDITYMGKVYGTDVDMPFWFRHFDKGERGAGDAHHIGVFGKSGSGKSVAAAYMLFGYAKNKDTMNILVIDPQGQFYSNNDFPDGFSLEDSVKKQGMKFEKHHILEDLYLPCDDYELFASLLQKITSYSVRLESRATEKVMPRLPLLTISYPTIVRVAAQKQTSTTLMRQAVKS